MLAFIDESGSIHHKDSNPISTLVAVCMPERAHRGVSRRLFNIRRRILGNDKNQELKATDLINPRTFRRIKEKRELVESVFSMIEELEVVIFAIIVPRPGRPIDISSGRLLSPHKFLLQRINALAESINQEAILIYDGNGMNIQGMNMSASISDYIFKVAEYNNILRRIVDTALFVDSKVTPGIQIADLAASVIRQCEQQALIESVPEDPYYLALSGFYNTLRFKTMNDLVDDYSNRLYGFYKMREEQLYQQAEKEE